jgi:type I restriction enzyme S subunit
MNIGNFMNPISIKCGIPRAKNVYGIDINKQFIKTKANISEIDTSRYNIVPPNSYAANFMHIGRDKIIPVALNNTMNDMIVSPAYFIFEVDTKFILPEYFYMVMSSSEFDRYAWFCTDSSVRGNLDWDRFCEIEIELPSILIQQKYVDVYNALSQNQKAYEKGLDDLKLTCDAYIENLRHKMPLVEIGGYIEQTEEYNSKLKYGKNDVMGMTITKEIISTKANIDETSFEKYIIVKPQHFIYNPRTHGKKIGLGYNNIGKTFIITWNNIAFKIKEQTEKTILPEFLYLFFKRDEWDRWACFNSWGSSTEVFAWEDLCETKIPIPNIEIQQAIVKIFNAYHERKMMAEKLKEKMKNICSILVKGAVGEASKK